MKKLEHLPGKLEAKPPLAMPNRIARLYRALTPYSQTEFGERTGIHPSTIGHIEVGDEPANAGHLEAMARVVRIPVTEASGVLRWCDSLGQPRVRAGLGAEALFAEVSEEILGRMERFYQRLLRLPVPGSADGSQETRHQMALLRILDEGERSSLVKSRREFQTHALAEHAAKEAAELASRDAESSAAWARLAQIIAHLADNAANGGPDPETKGR